MRSIDLGKKLNYAKEVFFDTCDAPFTAYVEAAVPAAIHAVVSYYCLDPVQIFTGYVRPDSPLKGRRKGGHGRGSRKNGKPPGRWRNFKKAFGFDPNEWIAKKMPLADDMAGRQVPGGARWMWQGYNQFERFQNFMFMYTLAENFFYETAMGVARSVYCQNQRASVFVGFSAGQAHFGILGVTACIIEEVLKGRGAGQTAGNIIQMDTKTFSVSFSCKRIRSWIPGKEMPGCYLRVRVDDGPPVQSAELRNDEGAMVSFTVKEGGRAVFETVGPISFDAEEIWFHAHGYRDEPTYRPDGWCNKALDKALNWNPSG